MACGATIVRRTEAILNGHLGNLTSELKTMDAKGVSIVIELARHAAPFSKILLCLALALSFIFATGVAIAKPDNITDTEMSLLPRYCPDTMGFNYGDAYSNTSPRAGHWVGLMGKSFWAMHHYCWGLIALNRSQKSGTPTNVRLSLWESARGDFGYVVKNAPPDFIMLPEIFTKIGTVELLLSHPDRANEAFSRARQLKPDYWPAYSHWAEYLMKIGKRPEALKVVASGLANAPGSKVLLEQYRTLGGKPSDIPKPVPKPLQEGDPGSSEDSLGAAKTPAGSDANPETK